MLDFANRVPRIVCPSESKGHIQVILGPMFSGKTTELIRRLQKYEIANHKCLIIKYPHDSRYSETGIKTHDSLTLKAVSVSSLCSLTDQAVKFSVIGIDEGQFFPDVVAFSEDMANRGKIVIVAALDGTYQRNGFMNILQLVPLSESIIKLKSVCMLCFEDASYTKRIGDETELEVIGGTDKYMALCRICYEIDSSSAVSASTSLLQDSKLESCGAKPIEEVF